jgi:hypothetical protein
MLAFGPEGDLYIGLGDGGSAGDPGNRAQNVSKLLGKILRINVKTRTGSLPYGIPSTNPFVGRTGDDRVWSYGLRNPWRFSFDRATGDLWIGDVGQDRFEEIDRAHASGGGELGFGWRVKEGLACYNRRPAAARPARSCRSPSIRTASAARWSAGTSTAARSIRRWLVHTCSRTTARAGSGR